MDQSPGLPARKHAGEEPETGLASSYYLIDRKTPLQPHNAADVHPASVAPSVDILLSRGKRLSGYLFWYGLRVLLEQGLPQLLLLPLCLHLMGAEGFGLDGNRWGP